MRWTPGRERRMEQEYRSSARKSRQEDLGRERQKGDKRLVKMWVGRERGRDGWEGC